MNRAIRTILILAVGLALAGCATDQRCDYHVFKLDRIYDRTISNPYEWALAQLSDGPISDPDVSDYAHLVLARGLTQALGDLGGDGTQELFLRQGWAVLVFTPVQHGYRYLGDFPASSMVLDPREPSVTVYEACGGKFGYIKTYRHNGQRFTGTVVQEIASGDGAPDENNRKLAELFSKDKVLKWTKVPDDRVKVYTASHAGAR
jgi:hypothetical protein